MGAIERELETARGLASRAGDEAALDEAAAELALLRKIETAAKLACGLLWMTGEWRQEKADAAYQALLESVGGSGSQGLRESIEAALAAGFAVDAPPGCYWPAEDDADDQCDAPPIGWRCTRSKGHSGPCAAVACPEDVDLVERGMQRLRETTNAKASGFETESS